MSLYQPAQPAQPALANERPSSSKRALRGGAVMAAAALLACGSLRAHADEPMPGASVESLLTLAKERNPE